MRALLGAVWGAAVACAFGCALAQPARALQRAEVLGIVLLDGRDAPLAVEASGLAWDADDGRLVLVSDRGTIQRLRIDVRSGRIERVTGDAPRRIGSDHRVNAESVCLPRPGDETWVVDERAADIVVIGASGAVLRRVALPAPLDDTSRYVYGKRGVEAIACHPRHGVIAIPQRPILPYGREMHRVHGADGRVWAFMAAREGKSAIKGLELIAPDRLLVLEQLSTADDSSHQVLLREVDLAACAESRPCDPRAVYVADPRLGAPDNFEGLACSDDTHCWIVSDGGKPPARSTRLVLIRLRRD